jgi:hypothetical protein
MRVLRPGGTLVVIDNDLRVGEFAELLRAAREAEGISGGTAADSTVDAWWAARGADRTTVLSEWRFGSRDDFEAVLRMEFPGVVGPWLTAHPGQAGLSYGYVLFAMNKQAGCPGQSGRPERAQPPRTGLSLAIGHIGPG